MHAAVTVYEPCPTAVPVFRNPLPARPPAPVRTTPPGRGPKSMSSSRRLFASSLARFGAAAGGGGGAGRDDLAGAAVGSGMSSAYSHPLMTAPEQTTASISAACPIQCLPPIRDMTDAYRPGLSRSGHGLHPPAMSLSRISASRRRAAATGPGSPRPLSEPEPSTAVSAYSHHRRLPTG